MIFFASAAHSHKPKLPTLTSPQYPIRRHTAKLVLSIVGQHRQQKPGFWACYLFLLAIYLCPVSQLFWSHLCVDQNNYQIKPTNSQVSVSFSGLFGQNQIPCMAIITKSPAQINKINIILGHICSALRKTCSAEYVSTFQPRIVSIWRKSVSDCMMYT